LSGVVGSNLIFARAECVAVWESDILLCGCTTTLAGSPYFAAPAETCLLPFESASGFQQQAIDAYSKNVTGVLIAPVSVFEEDYEQQCCCSRLYRDPLI